MDDSVPYAQEFLREQARAIEKLSDLLDVELERAVQAILNLPSEGRLIVSGIGKTGCIGMKISATFASIGVPSFFLHPAEAVHGDLGRVTAKDVVLTLSNSGNSFELVRMLPSLSRLGCPLIAITGRQDSIVAKRSHIVLCVGAAKESGPLSLAPTTSTTLMLTLGDALAMSVLKRKKFTREEFAAYHPGGTLGRTLMLVSEVMRKGDEQCVVPHDLSTRQVLHQITITKGRPGAASVVDDSGKLVGVFTDGDLRRCLDQRSDFLDLPISALMGKNPKTIEPSALADQALELMSKLEIDQVIVIDAAHRPIGMIDIQDIVQTSA